MSKILIADDDQEVRALVKGILVRAGHDVIEVSDGQSAAVLVGKAEYDLLVIDVSMPGLDGYHLASVVRNMPIKQPKIIIVTSRDFDRDRAAVMASEADVFISKPFESEELLTVVNQMIGAGA